MVVDDDSYAIALSDLNGRPGRAAVITPEIDGLVRHNLSLYRLGNQMEHFHAVIEGEGQVLQVGALDGYRRSVWRTYTG